MKAKFLRQYRKSGAEGLTYVYGIVGTPEEIAAYKAAKELEAKTNPLAKFIVDDTTKLPIIFTKKNAGALGIVRVDKDGKYWVNADPQQEMIQSLMKEGYSFEHAKAMAAELSEQ